jgi:hypothetical protein
MTKRKTGRRRSIRFFLHLALVIVMVVIGASQTAQQRWYYEGGTHVEVTIQAWSPGYALLFTLVLVGLLFHAGWWLFSAMIERQRALLYPSDATDLFMPEPE